MQIQRFKNSFAENIFKNKYAQGPTDTWDALAERLVEDVCGTRWGQDRALMSKEDRDQLIEYIKEMKFVPGGRYLWYAGRKNSYFNNCFSGDTRVLTERGWVQLKQVEGQKIKVLSPVDGYWREAEFKSYGKQKLNKITFVPVRGKSEISWDVYATRQHHWPLVNGTDTYDLRVGDVVPANSYGSNFEPLAFAHGFIFGDGNSHGQVRLCADKGKTLLPILEKLGTVTYPESANGDPVVYINANIDWKSLPTSTDSPAYIASFIRGWLAADGSETAGNKLCSVNQEALNWFRHYAPFAGIVITGKLRQQVRDVILGKHEYKDHTIYIQNYSYGEDFAGFKVAKIEYSHTDTVYCLEEPVHHRFVIDGGIDTFNCFLLRAEQDTREEWADLTQRAVSCLMTGGGIGIDYSILRPEGKPLSRTGGLSSGPIPLMQMINEVGRGVMQGGSRRSAIYASLNWLHEDIPKFLTAKNWSDQIKELKNQDFNFPAPLDMTNISVNYDDKWLYNADRANLNTFVENCRQAMKTGEPGFSFNFGEKQNETLRNACTEVTSEDDSDVCNLGSINISNIQNINEFSHVVELASKFLVCGTLRADLPYDKVYKVREKNRRLGLGLMGIHAWLLQRGYGYEVTPELHKWLEVYKNESKRSADEHCERLFISKPIAYRAIAPTGSIGILAGTTTGIEPLFAVAYKRRYLTEGTKWKYEYVVDTTADQLIKEYGLNPETIETAYGLSTDYERRIKFQADIQDYVDMSISSTINLPAWGHKGNNEDCVRSFAETLSRYAPRLRGFTCYPDGSRGGQPLTEVTYEEAMKHKGVVFEENVDRACTSGVCGI